MLIFHHKMLITIPRYHFTLNIDNHIDKVYVKQAKNLLSGKKVFKFIKNNRYRGFT